MALIDGLFALITSNIRNIGGIFPDVVVEEQGRDALIITEHPVERGAAISDHAFKRPVEAEMRCGFSDSNGGQGYAAAAYAELLALQDAREPFTVTTGKRTYVNMLIASLGQTTDERTENVLMISVGLKEVIIVDTQTTTAPPSAQAAPAQTAGSVEGGTKQLTEADYQHRGDT